MRFLKKFSTWLAHPVLLFYALPWLLVLLAMGTVAQRYLGLYHSERLFFGSFLLWIGPVPLPGAYATLSLIAAALIAKLLLKSPLRKRSIGNVITHASVLLLLLGGLVSAAYRQEGYITLFPGDSSHSVSDYHDREMVVQKNNQVVEIIPFTGLRQGALIAIKNAPFSIRTLLACYPCAAVQLPEPDMQGYGMASAMKLVEALPDADDSQNRAGAMVEITGAKKEQNGRYIVMEQLSDPPDILIGDDHYSITMRPLERALPFTLQLLNFVQENYPGTAMAREYRSDLQVTDGALSWKTTISMNEPLRYRGYTVYQSSFVDGNEKKASVLAVVKNVGWMFPYLSIATLVVGLLVHLFMRIGAGKNAAVAALLLISIAFPFTQSRAQTPANFDYTAFAHMPILHEGRMKPMDSFARALLKGMTGESHFKGYAATVWLAQVLFDPEEAAAKPLFPVRSAQLLDALSLQKSLAGRYSFNELAPALSLQDENIKKILERDPKSYSEAERELVHLYDMMNLYANLSGSLTLLMPLGEISPATRSEFMLPDKGNVSYFALLKTRHALMEKLSIIVAAKGNNIPAYTPQEQDIAHLAFMLDSRENMQKHNALLRVIPGQFDSKEEWLSPWQVVMVGETSPESGKLFSLWGDLITAWNTGNADAWINASTALGNEVHDAQGARGAALELEIQYNQWAPLGKAMLGYAVTLMLVLAAITLQRRGLLKLAYITMAASIALHGGAVLARMIILLRPPVSTLYESMIFVSLIASLCGWFLSWRRKSGEGILAGSFVALTVLFLADIFAGDGDTLEMLTAVLNTNFWLGTHVVCITAGYGFSLVAGVMAHIYLFRRAMATPREELGGLFRLLHTLALVALFFTTTGTMLGGIWADQSWGRFWGWDPKENGALAIVLWLVWVLHGRIAGQLRETAFASMLALTTIVVALAWVGVNLLSVGLHSYGFTSAAAWGLPIFCLTELIIVAMLSIFSAQHYHSTRYANDR